MLLVQLLVQVDTKNMVKANLFMVVSVVSQVKPHGWIVAQMHGVVLLVVQQSVQNLMTMVQSKHMVNAVR